MHRMMCWLWIGAYSHGTASSFRFAVYKLLPFLSRHHARPLRGSVPAQKTVPSLIISIGAIRQLGDGPYRRLTATSCSLLLCNLTPALPRRRLEHLRERKNVWADTELLADLLVDLVAGMSLVKHSDGTQLTVS